jgi:hypothetical protein
MLREKANNMEIERKRDLEKSKMTSIPFCDTMGNWKER